MGIKYKQNNGDPVEPVVRAKNDFHPSDIPAKPGIYIFRNRFSKVIYVGKAANLRKRVSGYFQPSRRTTADPKLRSLINSIAFYETHPVKTESESLLFESRMIKEYTPRYNVLLRDDKRYLLVKINFDEKFPVLKLARLRKNDRHTYFGPFPKGGALKRTVDFLMRKFGLRTCRSAIPNERDRKHCLAGTVKDCCEPCVGVTSETEYKKRVDALAKVLNGDVAEIVREISELMNEKVERRRFEKAAECRDIIENIETIFGGRNRNFRYATIPKDKNAAAALDALKDVLGLLEPPKAIEAFDISNISGSLAVASMVRFTDGQPDTAKYRRFRIRGDGGGKRARGKKLENRRIGEQGDAESAITPSLFQSIPSTKSILSKKDVSTPADYPLGRGGNDCVMMEEAVFRRYSRISREIQESKDLEDLALENGSGFENLPHLILIDGGKEQLHAAMKALKRSCVCSVPVIGLAKRNEEIFVPGRQLPIKLDLRNPAMNLLRAIRDEAHRFAVSYHKKLRNSRIEESILDQIPGIGSERKRKLLRAFGSVGALRKAMKEDIAIKVPGIGAKIAEILERYLASTSKRVPDDLSQPSQKG
ncbi:MAG: excinuclease ABC subunit UvrC [Victivallales bacterium]|nr:excinuclease ABC subunit UvrC [Victivallales bacterium]